MDEYQGMNQGGSQHNVSQYAQSPQKGKRKQVGRACSQCAAAHVACSDHRPCTRCSKRGIPCHDRERKRRRRNEVSGGDEEEASEGNPMYATPGFMVSQHLLPPLTPMYLPSLAPMTHFPEYGFGDFFHPSQHKNLGHPDDRIPIPRMLNDHQSFKQEGRYSPDFYNGHAVDPHFHFQYFRPSEELNVPAVLPLDQIHSGAGSFGYFGGGNFNGFHLENMPLPGINNLSNFGIGRNSTLGFENPTPFFPASLGFENHSLTLHHHETPPPLSSLHHPGLGLDPPPSLSSFHASLGLERESFKSESRNAVPALPPLVHTSSPELESSKSDLKYPRL